MAFNVENLETLIGRIETAYLNNIDSKMSVSAKKVNARILANACNALNHYVFFMSKQILPTTAEKEYLEQHCAARGIFRKRKVKAGGRIAIKGVVAASVIKDTILNRKRDNLDYVVDSSIILASEETEINITCSIAGAIGNCQKDEIMTFAVALAGIENEARVVSVGAGADDETDADLLARYLNFMQNVAEGGAKGDYERWALEIEGVNRAWCTAHEMGSGTVTVRIMTPTGIADEQLCKKVKEYIDKVKPVTVKRLLVVTLIEEFVMIKASIIPNTPEVRTAAEAELQSLFKRNVEPQMKIVRSKINEAISIAPGEEDHNLIEPTADLQASYGAYLILQEVIWI